MIKIGFVFKNPIDSLFKKEGLTYDSTMTLQDAVNKDTDGDGVPDWEESLYGLDPTKKETTPGTPDSVTIQKLVAQNQTEQGLPLTKGPENLTQTDKFSQDLMATVTTLSQNGGMDEITASNLGDTLAQQIQNTPVRKVYILTDLKILKDDSYATVKKYADTLATIYKKNPTKYTILDILQKFSADQNNPDISALALLDPNIKQISGFIDGMAKISVPSSLASLHLNVLNDFERVVENLNDLKLYNTDPIVALGGMTKYNQNATTLVSDVKNLAAVINQKLKP
ncbi:hypothetical protein HY311_00990 [Candidatus Nomurabacteria bacterium]|nr:hypothetical protein [Candidatus Nomurabacteria bacterium]